MTRLKTLLAGFLSITLSSCSTFQVSDIGPMVQLPYSKECFQVFVLSGKEKLYPPEKCEALKKRGVILTSETWKILRNDIQTNCQLNQCKQIQGALDALFLAIDEGASLGL